MSFYNLNVIPQHSFMIVLGRSKVDSRGRVLLPRSLRGLDEVVFVESYMNGEKVVVIVPAKELRKRD